MATKLVPSAPSLNERLISVGEVAQLCGLSSRSVWRLADSGAMPRPLAIGGSRRWKESDLRAWLASGCQPVRDNDGGAAR